MLLLNGRFSSNLDISGCLTDFFMWQDEYDYGTVEENGREGVFEFD
jgi:hypothetical protein